MKANKSSPSIDVNKSKSYKESVADGDSTPESEDSQPSFYVNDFPSDPSDYITSPKSSSVRATLDSCSSSPTSPHHTTALSALPHPIYSDARGVTDWAQLHDHTAKWEHKLAIVVRMDVDRETMTLSSTELKLIIMQRVVPGDRDSPQQPRMGVVRLNLAEYANAGLVARRYLLRESKTNAILKLTVELEHIGGEQKYKAPPLQKGEILAQVSGLLANPGFHRANFLRDLETFENPTFAPEDIYHPENLDGLSSSQSIRTTEFLIETLFNPITSANVSPFTRDVPLPDSDESSFESSFTEQMSADSHNTGARAPSMTSTHSKDSSSINEKSKPVWWRRVNGSRPRTPNILVDISTK